MLFIGLMGVIFGLLFWFFLWLHHLGNIESFILYGFVGWFVGMIVGLIYGIKSKDVGPIF